jgi:hypothetical protein
VREDDGGDGGQLLHDLVGGDGEGVEVDVARTGREVAVGLDEGDELDEVVVHVAVVLLGGFAHLVGVAAREVAEDFAVRPEQLADGEEFAAGVVDLLQCLYLGVVDDAVLDGFEAVLDGVEAHESSLRASPMASSVTPTITPSMESGRPG